MAIIVLCRHGLKVGDVSMVLSTKLPEKAISKEFLKFSWKYINERNLSCYGVFCIYKARHNIYKEKIFKLLSKLLGKLKAKGQQYRPQKYKM